MKKIEVKVRDLNDLLAVRAKKTPPLPVTPLIPAAIDTYDWSEAFKYAQGVQREDVIGVVGIENGENDGAEWIGLFLLRDGRFMLLQANCDYTGWGCQEGGSSTFYKTRKAAIQDIGDANLDRLGLKMEY